MIQTLNSGADALTMADQNEESANLLALNTRQSLAQTTLSISEPLEIGGAADHRRNWTAMNLCFSLAQAGGASGMVWLMHGRQSYAILFWISAAALAVSALCVVAIAMLRFRHPTGDARPGIA